MKRRDFLKAAIGTFAVMAFAGSLKAASSSHYVLNETASRILELKREGLGADEIARKLTEEYEVDYREAYRDVLNFLAEARRLGIA